MALRNFSKKELLGIFETYIKSSDSRELALSGLEEYLAGSFKRFSFTLDLVTKWYGKQKGRVLEVGSFPFFMTSALLELGDDEVIGTAMPDGLWPGQDTAVSKQSVKLKTSLAERDFVYWTLNAEKDRLPFEDGSFDMVIFAEVLEHLIQSPSAMICEINRVLKPGALLILTTPNGLYWKHVYKLIFFGVWEQYSRYGVYGRHNRLWAPDEVKVLLEGNGFDIAEMIVNLSDTDKTEFASRKGLTAVNLAQDAFLALALAVVNIPLPFFRKKKADQIYVAAKKNGASRGYCPERLYSRFKPSYHIK